MKQPLLSLVKTEKLFFLKKSMTENSKNACWLLLSVILLTGTVMGTEGPLGSRVRQMVEQTNFMRKEIALYREFAENQNSMQKIVQQQDLLQKLQEQVPERMDPEKEVQKIYHLAGLHGITVQKLKQIPEKPVSSDKKRNRVSRFCWETEFYGTWQGLTGFFSDLETQGPCTRMEALQIREAGANRKETVFPGSERYMDLSVSGRVCMYYYIK